MTKYFQCSSYLFYLQTAKIFIGGLKQSISENDLVHHFEQFGNIEDVYLDSRIGGWGSILFENNNSKEDALKAPHVINGVKVDVQKCRRVLQVYSFNLFTVTFELL